MLDRYKKKGGFVQLITLIETSGKQKQEQFLTLIGQEDPAWEQALKSKILSVERILRWPGDVLVEVFTRVQPLTLAVAFHGYSQEKIDQVFSCMSNTDKRKLMLMMSEQNPTAVERSSCLVKLLGEVRGLINQNVIKLEKFDHEMHIPENFEEHIHQIGEISKANEETSTGLVFPGDGGEGTSRDRSLKEIQSKDSHAGAVGRDGASKEEIDFLKKRVNQLAQENSTLKHEVLVLKNKLEQIRKIA